MPLNMGDKSAWRTHCRSLRRQMGGAECSAKSKHIAQHVFSLIQRKYARAVIASYVSLPGEVQTSDLHTFLLSRPHGTLLLPRVIADSGSMMFHVVSSVHQLSLGYAGIPEPCASIPTDVPQVMILPGLAFDVQGHRLGMGRGFYDRYIAQCRPRPYLIALSYDAFVFSQIPSDLHDEPVDLIVTETQTFGGDEWI